MQRIPYFSYLSIKIEEAYVILEREPRSFLDINALIQTMSLQKFKFLTSRYVSKMRCDRRREIHAQISADGKQCYAGQKTSLKYKYLMKLPLKNQTLDCANIIINGEGCIGIENMKISCDTKWPVCAFDHSFKLKYTNYFQYRVGNGINKDEFIDDYFDNIDEYKKKPIFEDRNNFDNLLIERNRHYCTNDIFTTKINMILAKKQDENVEDAFPVNLIDLPLNESQSFNQIMLKFIDHIINYKMRDHHATVKEKFMPASPKNESKEKQAFSRFDIKKVFKTMTSDSLSEYVTKSDRKTEEEKNISEERAIRNSICVDSFMMLSQMNDPLSRYMAKIAKKTKFLKRDPKITNSPSGKFFMMLSKA